MSWIDAGSVLIGSIWLILSAITLSGWRRFEQLDRAAGTDRLDEQPFLSLIVPARNEAVSLEAAIRRLVMSDYPALQIILVNDRSTDATAEIADRLALELPQVEVVHVRELPAEWLGKTHALWRGYQASRGEWLCFIDADVLLSASVLRQVMTLAVRRELDYVTLFPTLIARSVWARSFVTVFGMLFASTFRPWSVKNRRSSAFCGVGAFQWMRRSAYERLGTHKRLRMEIADDVCLGKLAKQAGLACDALGSSDQVRVEWQQGSIGAYLGGIEKNAFAGFRYSVVNVVVGTTALAAFHAFPFAGVFFLSGWGWWGSVTAVGLMGVGYVLASRNMAANPLYVVLHPVTILLMIAGIWRSTLRAIWHGSVEWRGTRYPIEELRRHMV